MEYYCKKSLFDFTKGNYYFLNNKNKIYFTYLHLYYTKSQIDFDEHFISKKDLRKQKLKNLK